MSKPTPEVSHQTMKEVLKALYPKAPGQAARVRLFAAESGISENGVYQILMERRQRPTVPLGAYLGALLRLRRHKALAERLGL